jgi:ribosome-binding protein aMBF1 (putative translation factor)
MNTTNTIGERIRQIRHVSGLSVPQLSAIIKIDSSTIRRWESGEMMPKADSLSSFVIHLDINANWLVTGDGTMKNLSDKVIPDDLLLILNIYDKLPDDMKNHLKDTIHLYQKFS